MIFVVNNVMFIGWKQFHAVSDILDPGNERFLFSCFTSIFAISKHLLPHI